MTDKSIRKYTSLVLVFLFLIGCNKHFSQIIEPSERIKNKNCEDSLLRKQLENADSLIQDGEESIGVGHSLKVSALTKLGFCEEHWKQAVEEFELAVKHGADSVTLRIEIGNVFFYQIKDYPKAIEQFKNVINRDKSNRQAHLSLSKIYIQIEKWKEALESAETAKQVDNDRLPKDFYAYYEARALGGLKRYWEAQEKYKQFLKFVKENDVNIPEIENAQKGLKEIERILQIQK